MDGFDLFSGAVVKVDYVAEARSRLRKFQMRHGPKITPEMSVKIDRLWHDHLEKNPDGSTLPEFVDRLFDIFERSQK